VSELQKMNNFETVNGWLLRPAKDREGFAEPDEVAIELGIGLRQVTELVRRYGSARPVASRPLLI
jgi:hypothetical protein